jgi:hypothetical protein
MVKGRRVEIDSLRLTNLAGNKSLLLGFFFVFEIHAIFGF